MTKKIDKAALNKAIAQAGGGKKDSTPPANPSVEAGKKLVAEMYQKKQSARADKIRAAGEARKASQIASRDRRIKKQQERMARSKL